MKCNVVCIQTSPLLYKKEENLARMKELFIEAMNAYPNTDLVVFPELAATAYECGEAFQELAEVAEKGSYSIDFLGALAKEYGVHVIFGMAERDAEDPSTLYNSSVLLDDEGEVAGVYQKVHLFDGEKLWFTPGKEFKVFDTKIGRLGLFICYDAFFPEAARCMAVQGVDLLVNSTSWEKPYDWDMDMVMMARALENTVYLACCNRIGTDHTLSFFGHTRILNQLGQVMTTVAEEAEGIIYASLDYEKSENMKKDYYTMLSERRPELYGQLV